jgi:hypothetical protein
MVRRAPLRPGLGASFAAFGQAAGAVALLAAPRGPVVRIPDERHPVDQEV